MQRPCPTSAKPNGGDQFVGARAVVSMPLLKRSGAKDAVAAFCERKTTSPSSIVNDKWQF